MNNELKTNINTVDKWLKKYCIKIKNIVNVQGDVILIENDYNEWIGECYYVFSLNRLKKCVDVYSFFKCDVIKFKSIKKLFILYRYVLDKNYSLHFLKTETNKEKIVLQYNKKYYDGCKIDTIKGDFYYNGIQ